MDSQLRQVIRTLIEEFLGSHDPEGVDLELYRMGARKHRFLPVHFGWFDVYGISEEGPVVIWRRDPPADNVVLLEGPVWRRRIYFLGASKYPRLAPWVERRPANAVDCPTCRGNERPPPSPILCHCFGVGWFLPGEPLDPFDPGTILPEPY